MLNIERKNIQTVIFRDASDFFYLKSYLCTEKTIIQPLWTVLKMFQSPRGDPSHWSGFWSWSEPLIWILILIRATDLGSGLDPSHWSGFWTWSEPQIWILILTRATDLDSDLDPSHRSGFWSWSEPQIWTRILIRATGFRSPLKPHFDPCIALFLFPVSLSSFIISPIF